MLDEILPAYHTQQQTLQIQSIAQQHSIPTFPPTPSRSHLDLATPSTTPATPTVSRGNGLFMSGIEPPPTPASQDGEPSAPSTFVFPKKDPAEKRPRIEEPVVEQDGSIANQEPQKKKRRVVLTRVGDLGS